MDFHLVMLVLILVVGFYMAWNIGANDVSNAMGTSVGSGALTLLSAIFIAAILEFSGALLLGSNVSETMQSGLIDPQQFENTPKIFAIGMLCALLGTSIWLQVASFFGWPVSTTHAIVGAILGFGGVIGGISAIKWNAVGSIALSWVISPAMSGLFAFIIFSFLQKKILYSINPTLTTKKVLPYLIAIVFTVFTISVLFGGLKNLKIHLDPLVSLGISFGIGIVSYLISFFCVKKVKIDEEFNLYYKHNYSQQLASLNKTLKHLKRAELAAEGDAKEQVSLILLQIQRLTRELSEKAGKHNIHSEYAGVEKMFSYLQVLSACYVAFAHGANDVANAIGPVAAVINSLNTPSLSQATHGMPVWLLGFGGAGIVIGLATWGWRVIQTIGKKITELTPTRGFSAEFGAAVTVLVASKLGLPISTTHCIVGAVLGVGLAKGISAINLKTVTDIVLSWIITIPCSAILSIILYHLFSAFLLR